MFGAAHATVRCIQLLISNEHGHIDTLGKYQESAQRTDIRANPEKAKNEHKIDLQLVRRKHPILGAYYYNLFFPLRPAFVR